MNILITGASRGIGFVTAKLFSEDTTHKILCISRKKYSGPNPNQNIFSIEFDFGKGDIQTQLLPEVKKHFSSIDILINNAATLVNKPFEQLTNDDWKQTFEINLYAPARLIQSLLPFFSKNKSHIVNIGSMGGYQGSKKFPGLSAYSSSKGALAILTECLAEELAEKNISVNCLCLGSVQTEMFEAAFPGAKASMTPTQMAQKIVAFSLTAHKTMTGKIVPVSISNP